MEQVDRANRYLSRIRSIYEGVSTDSDEKGLFEDDVISFFMHCYHIRDWILHLNNIGITAAELDLFINSHEELKICADLCNGSKHCKLERKTRSGRQPHIAYKAYSTSTWLTGSGGFNVVKGRYSILTNAGPIDALVLAEKCMALWSDFLGQAKNKSFKADAVTAKP